MPVFVMGTEKEIFTEASAGLGEMLKKEGNCKGFFNPVLIKINFQTSDQGPVSPFSVLRTRQ